MRGRPGRRRGDPLRLAARRRPARLWRADRPLGPIGRLLHRLIRDLWWRRRWQLLRRRRRPRRRRRRLQQLQLDGRHLSPATNDGSEQKARGLAIFRVGPHLRIRPAAPLLSILPRFALRAPGIASGPRRPVVGQRPHRAKRREGVRSVLPCELEALRQSPTLRLAQPSALAASRGGARSVREAANEESCIIMRGTVGSFISTSGTLDGMVGGGGRRRISKKSHSLYKAASVC